MKVHEIETTLHNKGLFSRVSVIEGFRRHGTKIVFATGLLQFVCTGMFLFHENFRQKVFYANILRCFLLFDAMIVHQPFACQNEQDFLNEMVHCALDLAVVGTLYLIASRC